MAIWQFKFDLVSYAGLIRKHRKVPHTLAEYAAIDIADYDESAEYINYWNDFDPRQYIKVLSQLVKPTEGVFVDGVVLGNEEENCIRIISDGLEISLDVREFDRTLLKNIVTFAQKENLYIVAGREGRVFPPSYDAVITEIEQSTALKYCLEPKKTLLALSASNDG